MFLLGGLFNQGTSGGGQTTQTDNARKQTYLIEDISKGVQT